VNSTQNLFVLEVPRHFVVPNTQQWNLTVQRDLGRKWVLEVGYVGTKGTHLRETRDADPVGQRDSGEPVHCYRYQWQHLYDHQQYFLECHRTHAHARIERLFGLSESSPTMPIPFTTRFSPPYRGAGTVVTFQAAYTFSKNIDATSTGNTANNTAFNDESTINASRGISDFNRPQVLKVSYVYDLPFFAHAAGFRRAALGGWSVSGVTSLQSSLPFSVLDSNGGNAFWEPGRHR